ncbi:helix-turn-helix domain-containing protein [Hymenobacter canadensis]|uniref:helix-turn-helix domain-containing protein n=1 Tax=Hymenobacter canadensis TaxID=2999067 RepID=UPI0033144B56
MVERIREILQSNQLTPTQFADSIGVARPIISHILSGRNKPSLEVVQKIVAAFPQLSLDWLLRGAGSMLAGTPVAASAADVRSPAAATLSPEQPSGQPVAQKAAKAPRYQPQPASVGAEYHQRAESAQGGAPAYLPLHAVPVAPVAVAPPTIAAPAAAPPVVPGSQSGMAAATVAATAPEPVAPVLAVAPVTVEAVAATASVATPVQAVDVSLASAFAEPGRVIRRIVIFYQDGTFTDYQPEPRLS